MRNSKFSAEVIEALMLAVKENAHECKLDFFVKVGYMLHMGEISVYKRVAVVNNNHTLQP